MLKKRVFDIFKFVGLILCIFIVSCSFDIKDKGAVSFKLPTRSIINESDSLFFDIQLKQLFEKQEIIYNNRTTDKIISIEDIPVGNYLLVISGEDSAYRYFGENEVLIIGGKNTKIKVELKKSKKDDVIPPVDKTLCEISTKLKSNVYVEYGKNIDINSFEITEKYKDGSSLILENNSSYKVEPSFADKVGDFSVTIKHKSMETITANSKIPCKYTPSTPKASLLTSLSGKIAKFIGTKDLTVDVEALSAPSDKDTFVYQWQSSNSENSGYSNIDGATSKTYQIKSLESDKYYRCEVKTKAGVPDYSLSLYSTAVTTNPILITCEPWTIKITGADNTEADGDNLKEGEYTLSLENTTGTKIPGNLNVLWSVNGIDFSVNANKLKTPTVTEQVKNALITATIDGKKYSERNISVTNRTLQGISAKLKPSAYITYGKDISIDSFIITETYSDQSTKSIENGYVGYTVSLDSIASVGNNNTATIKKATKECKVSNIPCKYNIETPTVSITAVGATEVEKNSADTKLKATVSFNDKILSQQYNAVSYQWQKKSGQSYVSVENGTTAEFTVPTTEVGPSLYNCFVTVTPKDSNFCLDSNKTTSASKDITITVKDIVVKSISAVLKPDSYITYGTNISIDSFTITETYSDQSTQTLSSNSEYTVSSTTSATVGNTNTVTISGKSLTCNVSNIPCKYNIETPSVTLLYDAKDLVGAISLVKGDSNPHKLSVNVSFKDEELSKNYKTASYQWQKKEEASYVDISSATGSEYNIPTDVVGDFEYKCKITIEPNDAPLCINGSVTIESSLANVKITANESSLPNEIAVADFDKLKTELGNLSDTNNSVNLLLTGDIIVTEGIKIGKSVPSGKSSYLGGNYNVTLRAASPISIKRGTSYTGTLFTVGNGCTLSIQGAGKDSQITLDGESKEVKTQLIKSYGELNLNYCSLINNININTGTNKGDFGSAIYLGYEKNGAPTTGKFNLTMKNSTVSDNKSNNNGIIYLYSNASYNFSGTIENCTIKLNKTIQGNNKNNGNGTVLCENGNENSNSTLDIINSQIIENSVGKNGGGISLERITLNLDNTTVSDNTAASGGGLNIKGTSSVTLKNNSLIQNNKLLKSNNNRGGGVSINSGGSLNIVSGEISKNIGDLFSTDNLNLNPDPNSITVNNKTVSKGEGGTYGDTINQSTDITTLKKL